MSEKYISIGHIIRLHGFNGNVICKLNLAHPEALQDLSVVFLKMGNGYVPFFTERFSIQNKKQALAKFEEINSEAEARDMIGTEIFLPETSLPKIELSVGQYLGFEIINAETGKSVGIIEDVLEIPGNPLAVVQVDANEVYIPINPDMVRSSDPKKKQLVVKMADGLFDLN